MPSLYSNSSAFCILEVYFTYLPTNLPLPSIQQFHSSVKVMFFKSVLLLYIPKEKVVKYRHLRLSRGPGRWGVGISFEASNLSIGAQLLSRTAE